MMSRSPQAIHKITGEQFYGILTQPEVKHSFKLSNEACETNNILFQHIKTQGEKKKKKKPKGNDGARSWGTAAPRLEILIL